ncbi:hypothetical protein COEREDRAFT_79425 [Coemansia reversa NRRL 1564]|uniref:Uncharacterized protein n=1 Tax=Coemansia reversa (strain ATCC 12441 / NRRL 1564) TaxID=763665 RepID=A0A2G5BIS7_COERN|nr:hypothetical protein COEREDRAFT_79425 [Coemansia reversa NRRL 1564]|eukprot:PIA18881.1 hypothetical protein COEREDRAFT_79425 [Coemansia reversa NRRL 1564]
MVNKAGTASNTYQAGLHEWETEAKELASRLQVSAKETGPALLREIGMHINLSAGSGTNASDIESLEKEIVKVRLGATQELDTRQGLEKSVLELKSKLSAFAEGEAEVGRVLENLVGLDKVPNTVPALLWPGLERAIQDVKARRNGSGKE